MTEKQFSKGTIIFHEGDHGETFFRVISGTVGIYSSYGTEDEYLIRELKSGDYFGEMAVIETYPRSATAVAISDSSVEESSTAEMGLFFKDNPEKILEITDYIGKCIRDTTDDYIEVTDTIEKLGRGEKKESLMDKLKKFGEIYSSRKKEANKPSAEASRKFSATGSDAIENFPKATVIFKQGDVSDCMYQVQGGCVDIYSDYGTSAQKKLATVSDGEFFGEMGLIGNKARSATAVTTIDNTTIEIIKKTDLLELFKNNPPMAEAIVVHLSEKLRQVTKKYLESCHLLYEIYTGSVMDNEVAKVATEYKTYNGVA